MNSILKSMSAILTFVLILTLSSCSKPPKEIFEIALIPTEKNVLKDKSFNQAAIEGIMKYAEESDVKYKTYEPEAKTEEQYIVQIDAAISEGAKIIILPGYNFEKTVFAAQEKYPDIKFVLLDGIPNNGENDENRMEKVSDNTYSVFFAEEQAGFLAGYAIVKEGYNNLSFLGGKEFPAVIRYGFGFIQGAEYAAKELNLSENTVKIRYGYCGDFMKTPQNQAFASYLYNEGTDVIFACGGSAGLSVMEAAKGFENKWVIGVDSDQSSISPTVITSSMKMLDKAVYNSIKNFYSNTFPGGKSVVLGAEVDAVGIATDTSRFNSFTKEDYNKIYEQLKNNQNNLATSIDTDIKKTANQLNTKYVSIELAEFK